MRGLRGRLTLVYALALLAGLLLFAAISLLVLDRSARTTLDARLVSEAKTITSLFEVRNGHVLIEETDRTQFQQILGVKLSGAVYDSSGKELLSTSVPVPSQVYQLVLKHPQETSLATVGPVDGKLRVAAVPILSGTRVAGVAVLWRSLDSIQDLDRRSALVFAFAIPVIVAFAIFFGTLVAKRGLAPLRRLADLASDIEAHDLSRRSESTRNATSSGGSARRSIACSTDSKRLSSANGASRAMHRTNCADRFRSFAPRRSLHCGARVTPKNIA